MSVSNIVFHNNNNYMNKFACSCLLHFSTAWGLYSEQCRVCSTFFTMIIFCPVKWSLSAFWLWLQEKGHTDQVTDVCWHPDGATLYSSSLDGHVVEWSVASSQVREWVLWLQRWCLCSLLMQLSESWSYGLKKKKKSSFETGQMGIIGFGVISCCTW